MLRRLIAFLLGHLYIEVTGGRIERFLNLALEEGIYLWNIRRFPDKMQASMTIRDFFQLRGVARGSRCRVRILRRYGFPFKAARLRRRPVLLAGALASVGFVMWASSHVWVVSVKVTGPQNLDPRAVRAVAAEAGLALGVTKGRVDVARVEKHIVNRIGEISWAVIRMQGTRAVIEVVEKATSRLPDQAACVNLHARREGVIEQVVPFQGEPKVKKGDIVRPGDLLVECSLRYYSGGRPALIPGTQAPQRETIARTLVAQADVKARVSYSEYIEIPLYQEVAEPTGQVSTRWVLNWNGKPILAGGERTAPFDRHKERRESYSLGSWRNWRSPVELVILTAEEIAVRRERTPESKALDQARELMARQLRWVLGPTDRLLTPMTATVVERGSDTIGVRVRVETLEDISEPREGSPVQLKPAEPEKGPGRP